MADIPEISERLSQVQAEIDALIEAQQFMLDIAPAVTVTVHEGGEDRPALLPVAPTGRAAVMAQLQAARLMVEVMQLSASVMDECQVEEPYRPIRTIFERDEHGKVRERRCCLHNPPHCIPDA